MSICRIGKCCQNNGRKRGKQINLKKRKKISNLVCFPCILLLSIMEYFYDDLYKVLLCN